MLAKYWRLGGGDRGTTEDGLPNHASTASLVRMVPFALDKMVRCLALAFALADRMLLKRGATMEFIMACTLYGGTNVLSEMVKIDHYVQMCDETYETGAECWRAANEINAHSGDTWSFKAVCREQRALERPPKDPKTN
jgi:hypothetical protein